MRARTAGLLLILLSGCSTPYAPAVEQGTGYSESEMSLDTVRVRFKGGHYDSRERVEDFALLRSAEITLEKGYRYFVILLRHDNTIPGVAGMPPMSHSHPPGSTTPGSRGRASAVQTAATSGWAPEPSRAIRIVRPMYPRAASPTFVKATASMTTDSSVTRVTFSAVRSIPIVQLFV